MTSPPERPRRTVVRLADVASARRGPSDSLAFDERGEYRDVLVRSLMRAQLGLTLSFVALAAGVLISFPLVVGLVPSLADRHIFGLPFTLAALGVAVYPVLVVIAVVYVHLAERTERRFLDLVDKL
ncbi:MAG: hypothetical protein QOG69_2897 [Actinomycetota bacterium]|nr:hypothetical protein [Actinomycetota bacterium]MDQ1542266.1 hypothetical protein [Actinomycetota bacterium]